MTPTARRLTAALVGLGIATAGVASSEAWFASQDASRDSSVTAASVKLHVLTPTARTVEAARASSIVDASRLRPGGPARETVVELRNAGDVRATLAFAAAAPDGSNSARLLAALRLVVDDCGTDPMCGAPAEVYAGPAERATAVAFGGAVEAGDTRFARVRLSWPAAADDPDLYGLTTTRATLRWSAVNARSTP